MKTYKYIIMAGAALMALGACNKQEVVVTEESGEEIVLGMEGDFIASVDTRATAINNVAGLPTTLYWGATTGGNSGGTTNETQKWAVASATRSNASIATGKYQTATPTAYNYYVATQTFTIPSSGTASMTVQNNSNDVLAGRLFSSPSSNPTVELNHVFARTGTLTLTATNGFTIQGTPTWTIVGRNSNGIQGTAGTYNLSTGQWTAASTRLTTAQAITSSSDLYLIPGEYTITVNYTITKGDFTAQRSKSAYIQLTKGKINHISGSVTDTASEIAITVTVEPWDTTTINPTWN